jgi:hypothetical protein
MVVISKSADCVRRVGNWSKIEPKHRFDKRTFQKSAVEGDMELASPKLDALLDKIEELDAMDMKQEGRVYKHMIYSDVRSLGYGAKIVAAGLLSRGYHPAYKGDFTVSETNLSRTPYKNFALLCSTPVYDKPITVKLKTAVLQAYNRRPDNVYGKNIRILVLDQGYKEGIDVFDLKYMHLFEPAITAADERQAIGRGTRMCGQKGLAFHHERGWPMYVFRYNSLLPSNPLYRSMPTIHDLFLNLSGFDARVLRLANNLERLCILGAVDHDLTRPIHSFRIAGKASLHTIPTDVMKELMREKRVEKFVMYGREYEKGQAIRCKEGCKGIIPVPTPLMLLAWLVASNDLHPFYNRRPRSFLCKELVENTVYCRMLNLAWNNPAKFVADHKMVIQNSLRAAKMERFTIKEHLVDMAVYIPVDVQQALSLYPKTSAVEVMPKHLPPERMLPLLEMRDYISAEFGDYKWMDVSVEDLCNKGGASIVDLTPTQRFVKDYFQPSNPYKGMLLYQSMGTGKTCTAIATATNSFERENYTILWVTRHTLKSDIWKNMFDQVCSLGIQERMLKGEPIPPALPDRKRLLPPSWIEPISYKQFSNFLKGRNKQLEKLITARNGRDDPLHKTLIIIDEAHKLYAADVTGSEKPDVDVLRKMIQQSYEKSGKDSARLLLMTATPYTSDPMDLVRLLNFLREEKEQLPETFEEFSRVYLDTAGNFTTVGSARFLNEISGYISYLNRENDIRQFAYPILKDITVPISASMDTRKMEKQLEVHEAAFASARDLVQQEIPDDLRYIRRVQMDEKADCSALPTKEERDACKKEADQRYKAAREKIEKKLERANREKAQVKEQVASVKKELKRIREADISQETMIREVCLR